MPDDVDDNDDYELGFWLWIAAKHRTFTLFCTMCQDMLAVCTPLIFTKRCISSQLNARMNTNTRPAHTQRNWCSSASIFVSG